MVLGLAELTRVLVAVGLLTTPTALSRQGPLAAAGVGAGLFFGAGLFHVLDAAVVALIFGPATADLARGTRRTARTGHLGTQIRA
jgi:hypothetical protein